MRECNMEFPTMKELETLLFRKLQEQFAAGMARLLESLDECLMHQRDHSRYRLKDQREVQIDTIFGTVRFKRRLYQDRMKGRHVFLLDQMLAFDGREKLSPFLEEVATKFASQGPSYRDSAKRLEALLGYRALSHEAIRDKLIARAEQEANVLPEATRRSVRVLFVEVDGLYTSLQRHHQRGMENRMAIVHEGWERKGSRVSLKYKRHYLHTAKGDFWEGLGDFLVRHYDMDENTWLVVNGDGAKWIGECESYFHRCMYTLDRFHVARELRRFLGHLPKAWQTVRQALAAFDPAALLAAAESVPEEKIREENRNEWRKYVAYLRQHQRHLIDYREVLREAGIDTTGMRPMGSAEAQMRVMAKRTKRGGYSWSVRGVQAMLRAIMARQEGRQLGRQTKAKKDESQSEPMIRVRDLLREVKEQAKGYINGTIRLLHGPYQSSPAGLALKALRG
ncbi:ISLre2 family transposase [Brevibacillus marinus]|uniref:ISLre2 family transposase n=1 Tax=Brevibacillus marinus TaxID=2496837 RepID=UPI000F830447|nr:ISLre2 family transposase [Brevibacillus marinus]